MVFLFPKESWLAFIKHSPGSLGLLDMVSMGFFAKEFSVSRNGPSTRSCVHRAPPCGGIMAIAYGSTVRFIELKSGEEKTALEGPATIAYVAWSPCGLWIIAGSGNAVVLRRIDSEGFHLRLCRGCYQFGMEPQPTIGVCDWSVGQLTALSMPGGLGRTRKNCLFTGFSLLSILTTTPTPFHNSSAQFYFHFSCLHQLFS